MTAQACEQDQNRQIHILLADDHQRVLESQQSLLAINGFNTDIALGGASAIQRLDEKNTDIIILDLKMPDVDGFDVMNHIAASKLNTVVIAVSGKGEFLEISKAMHLGVYDYLRKPYEPVALITTLNNAVNKVLMERSHARMQTRLECSEKLHRFVVNNSPDIIFMLDDSGHFRFLNSKAEELLGYERSELIGVHISSIIDEDAEGQNAFFETKTIAPGGSETIEVVLKSRLDPKLKCHFEIKLCTIADQDGNEEVADARYRVYGAARDISDRIDAEAFINFQAYHDLLTHLPNRSLFKDRLDTSIIQAERNKEKLAVMFVDLDRFKVINDSLGHTMGDRLLQAVSNRLLQSIRKSDTLSRFGGDEFTLLLPKIEDRNAAAQVAEKILAALKKPFSLGGQNVHVGASIGIAMYPESAKTMDELMKNSDIAMYSVKNNSKGGFQFFSPEMSSSTSRRLLLEQDLRKAIENDQFEICYQPQVTAEKLGIFGVEALIRWNHPVLGRLYPSDFISIAEESLLIVELDKQTLRRACREIRQLHHNGLPSLRLSVNLSSVVLKRSDFIEAILDILSEEDFPAELLELEISESLLMHDRSGIFDNLSRLTARGVKLAIDDFGTGYSSLSYLQKFPIATLKIDRSFVLSIKDSTEEASIVKSIVSMAKGLKLAIVAEGVENKTQLEYLKSVGCSVVQGYLFSAATSLKEVIRRLSNELSLTCRDESAMTDPGEWSGITVR